VTLFNSWPNGNTGGNEEKIMDEQTTSITKIEMDNGFVGQLTARNTMFCSLKAIDEKGKAILFKAINNPEKRIADCINLKINAKDLFCETVRVKNEDGTEQECPRIVIIDDKGVGYQAVSLGVFSAMKKLIGVYGASTWEKPLPLLVKQITKGTRSLLTFDVETK
jgi:hypothetical protein